MRTDIHRPSAINPDDYEWVGFLPKVEIDNFEFVLLERERIKAHMKTTGGHWSTHEHGGSCHVCGAWANTMVIWRHAPTNTYIRTGEDCAEKMDFTMRAEFNAFRKAFNNALEAKAGKAKAEKLLEGWGLSEVWPLYDTPIFDEYEECTIQDMLCGLVSYGSLSDKQVALMKKLVVQIVDRDKIAAEHAAENEAADPAPVTNDRITIEGTVLSTKWDQDGYFPALKMLVKTVAGWKAWGTVPAAINEVERNDRIKFDAAFEVSKDDPKFGFFKRPTKARILEAK